MNTIRQAMIVACVVAASSGCTDAAPSTSTPGTTTPSAPAAHAADAAAPLPMSGESLYQVEGVFEDHEGRKGTLAVARGETTLMAMFYATCPLACPLLIGDIKRVLGDLTDAERARVHVVLVSLDPERDTPALLKETITTRSLDPKLWTMLRTDPTATRTLASALGVRYRSNEDDSIDHTSKIVLLNGDGVAVAARDTIGADTAAFVAQIRQELVSAR